MCWEQRNAVVGSSRSNTPVTPQPSAIWGRVVACLSLCYQNVLGAWNVRGRKVEAVVSTVAFLRRRATASPRRRIVALSLKNKEKPILAHSRARSVSSRINHGTTTLKR